MYPPQSAGQGSGAALDHSSDGGQENVLRISGTWTGDYTGLAALKLTLTALAAGDLLELTTFKGKTCLWNW